MSIWHSHTISCTTSKSLLEPIFGDKANNKYSVRPEQKGECLG